MPIITVRRHHQEGVVACSAGETVLSALEGSDDLPRADCGGRGVCGTCRVRVESGPPPPPTARERARLPAAGLARGLRLACQLRPAADIAISVDAPRGGAVWSELADLPSPLPATASAGLGIAVDLGSTNIRLSLLDLATNRRLAAVRGYNPQSRYGCDILTRLVRADADAGTATRIAAETRRALAEGVAALFERAGGGERHQVRQLRVVGNTAVLTLAAAGDAGALLDPDNWSRHLPCRLGDAVGWNRALRLDDGTDTALVDSLSGFVGSDLTSGVIAAGLADRGEPGMLLDFGTHTEIALWDGAVLWVAAAAGGPAFEGVGISCGVPAEAGAIHRVAWRGESEAPGFVVIGGGPPLGLCGSGLVDAVAGLRRAGLVAASGRFAAAIPRAGWTLFPGIDDRPPLLVTRGDIDALQRAKAAVAAAADLLLRRAGLAVADLGRVMVSGIFGRHLDLDHARAIGLLPAAPAGQLLRLEDSALRGCERLLAADGGRLQRETERLARPLNLAAEPDYEALFVEHLALAPFSRS